MKTTPTPASRAPDPWEAEALLFDAASAFGDARERKRFLEFACRGEPEMLVRLQALLNTGEAAEEFFEIESGMPVAEPETPFEEEGLGVSVGRYRLIERLGAGGCGVVYLAEQQVPVRRKVALKIIRIGLESPEAIARFETERQALASLNHPNIARILDAGTTANSRPYYVMELVDGESLISYCDTRRLSIRARLGIFLEVCAAIQHAHQKSVAHLDIKPSNILIDSQQAQPVPKVIDFGLARMEENIAASRVRGKAGQFTGTPAYMSPSQVAGEDGVDTRADVYSLGMVLGELLCGATLDLPPDLLEQSEAEIRRILLAARPQPPSVHLAAMPPGQRARIAESRSVREDRLVDWCREDLDWVVAKAVERDPERRYETVEALAGDIRRWLGDEPVSARPQTRRYRLAKMVKRNRLWFSAATLAIVGLVAGLGVATLLFFREKEARAMQETLRVQAEAAHRMETVSRQQWEHRSRIAEAAVRLRYRDFAGAEQWVTPIPAAAPPPSLEAVSVFKELAEWHRGEGRAERAQSHFLAMVNALSKIDRAHTDGNSDNFLPASTALARSGDPQVYESLRHIAIDLYGQTENRLVAERTLKACLLKPASPEILEQMRNMAGVLENGTEVIEWERHALALYYFRTGDLEKAESHALRGQAKQGRNQAFRPSLDAVLGLVYMGQGRHSEAMRLLHSASEAAGDRLREPLPHGDQTSGFWWDWGNLRILLEEAGWDERDGWDS
jgi:eukaryotic-like serine/threonine-protein kinase